MPILSGDIKLLASQVMDDIEQGGGAPTSTVIQDGASNSIFNDISELDRAGGRVNLRKVFASVQTDTTDTYLGGNVIVADMPDDPNVAVTLFSNRDAFDRRTAAASRIEAYLNRGPEWGGLLYENHIAGQRVIQLFQRPTADLPNVGQTLVLSQDEGLPTEKTQYVRAISVSSETRTFTVSIGSGFVDYEAAIVTVGISDALRFDFVGTSANRLFARDAQAAKVRDTVVADAATYVGAVPVVDTVSLGDYTVRGASIYTQLVPNSQTETPISDIRPNGLSAALVATGDPVTVNLTMGFTTAKNMHVGGPVYPGSLSIVRSGVRVTDSGGRLVSGGQQVGTIDYANGVASLATNVFGGASGTHAVTFRPATLPEMISDQSAIQVTAESRSLNYTFTLGNPPLPETMSVSYLAQGKWYVLRDNGASALSGSDSSFGSGTINYTTGSALVTLGALPDVGSVIVVQSYSDSVQNNPSNTVLLQSGKVFTPLNTDGLASEEKGSKPIKIGSAVLTWSDGGVTKTATDNGLGGLTGDATGTIDYSAGVVRISPNTLPAAGTVFLLDADGNSGQVAADIPLANGNIGTTDIKPGSVSFNASVMFSFSARNSEVLTFAQRSATVLVRDSGAGTLQFQDPGSGSLVSCGSIDYATGVINISNSPAVPVSDVSGPSVSGISGFGGYIWTWNKAQVRTRSCTILSTSADVTFSSGAVGQNSVSITVNQYAARVLMVPNYALRGVSFSLGASRYLQLTDNTLVADPSPTTGTGTPSGSVISGAGVVALSAWPTGASSTIADWRGVISPPAVGVASPFSAFATIFRTPTSPLRPGSLSVLGTMQDGTTFNVTAGIDGKINGTRVKGRINYEFGFAELYFVNPAGDPALNVDLTHLGISGLTEIPADLVMLNSIRYNAVAYSYLPIDADILGIDPVRLPQDGRVPIFRPGGYAVIGHTGTVGPITVSNGQTVNCNRVRLSRVRVLDANNAVINAGYSTDLEAGTVAFSDVSGYAQPIKIEHRIEDMAMVRDVQINGEVTFTRQITHDYPTGSVLSSALVMGDVRARVTELFDQQTWGNAWSDSVIGSSASASFNDAAYPITVTNGGTLTERWAIVFTNTTAFQVIGENIGVIATGNTSADCAPLNPATNKPYFTIPAAGWGLGWAAGNALRFNTEGAFFPVWVVRTIQQGQETITDDSFSLLIRGDVDRP
jgi:hypothetical protein